MRIASLVPSATEILFALGLGDQVVAVTHECDHPAAATRLPRLTATVLEPGLDSAAIDAAVRERLNAGQALYRLDEERLAELRPDLILTQAVCAVCAVDYDEVCDVAAGLSGTPEVLSLDPPDLGAVLADLERVAVAAGAPGAGTRLGAELEARIGTVREAVEGRPRPRVAALEWLDPIYQGGHWIPEMIAAAGGTDPLSAPGDPSDPNDWDGIASAEPDVVVVMPCGYYLDQSAAEARKHLDALAGLGARAVHAVDAAASFSRPGPRLADGIELLGHILHPDLVPEPRGLDHALIWSAEEGPA